MLYPGRALGGKTMNAAMLKDALSVAEKMLTEVTTVVFVDHGHEEKFILTDGIWIGSTKQFREKSFVHVVAQFWIRHRYDNKHYYTLSYKEGYHV